MKSQAQKRKDSRKQKNEERKNDASAPRGFSTDQRITIESINVSKHTLKHMQSETEMVALGLQETAIRAQLTHAQSMAERQCPKYNASNMFWQRADALQKRHTQAIESLMNLTNDLKDKSTEVDSNVNLSEFLLQESPAPKKRSFNDMIGNDNDDDNDDVVEVIEFDNDDESNSLDCKIEKMAAATTTKKKKSVSRRSKRRKKR